MGSFAYSMRVDAAPKASGSGGAIGMSSARSSKAASTEWESAINSEASWTHRAGFTIAIGTVAW